jgi:diguanylate cyclase (GGDEF)-like protein
LCAKEVCSLNWSGLPDLLAIALLACAFASVARGSQIYVSGMWLRGWLMIVLHFFALLFLPASGNPGILLAILIPASLTWAGHLFMYAAIPYREEKSSSLMFATFLFVNTAYILVVQLGPLAEWALTPVAILFGLGPLVIALTRLPHFSVPLRWVGVALHVLLSIYLLLVQHRPEDGANLALNAVLFTVYLGCCINFFFAYRRATAGAFVTIAGFFAWAMVFVVSPLMAVFRPLAHVESEVWNLPKYVVAVGMILLLLEDQIEHNKHLALHDVLTGLPNRRLFQDRLSSAIERARRTGSQVALMVIDLDHFKQVNDTLGHHVGDLLLQHVGGSFSIRARRSDTVARTGGDEFSVILEAPTDRAEAESVGASLMQLLKEPIDLEGHQLFVGASLGIAIYPTDATDFENLCIAADQRMYINKHATRKREEEGSVSEFPVPSRQTQPLEDSQADS